MLVLLPGEPVRAQAEGTWCLKYSTGPGSVGERCSFRTFEACRNERSLWGGTAFCTQNPGYLPYREEPSYGRGAAPKRLAQEEASAALALTGDLNSAASLAIDPPYARVGAGERNPFDSRANHARL